jgi:hypothetical protein
MFLTAHALNRVAERMGATAMQSRFVTILEAISGEPGTVAYIVGELTGKAHTPDGSNGELVVAVAVDGSVETVFFRRASQDITAAFFGARRVVDLRTHPLDSPSTLSAEPQSGRKRGA